MEKIGDQHTFIYFKSIVCQHLVFLGQKRDPDLLGADVVVPSEKHVKTSDLGFLI